MARNDRNPNNNQNSLFKTLTRMFSGPITQRRTQSGRQLRRRHLDMYAKRFKSASGQQFKKAEYNPMNVMALNMIQTSNLQITMLKIMYIIAMAISFLSRIILLMRSSLFKSSSTLKIFLFHFKNCKE